mmetsp:Transcript_35524/g.83190  ORF Transcript_35524/g.83190 Transcript_35524/m.83190 type:complete len:83 (-) Transcript_35524:254-502(-)
MLLLKGDLSSYTPASTLPADHTGSSSSSHSSIDERYCTNKAKKPTENRINPSQKGAETVRKRIKTSQKGVVANTHNFVTSGA